MSEQLSYINYFADYNAVRKSLFLGEKFGLVENIRKEFPKIWDLNKRLKALDWDENEFDITPCRAEFQTKDKEISDLMIRTLAWQFEADSSASHISALMTPFVNNTELFVYLGRLADNECLHSLAYKVIVESSFEDPQLFIQELLSIKESFQRLDTVKRIFDEIYELGHKYALGLEKDEHKIRVALFKFWVTLLALERIQFMSSFSITFGLAEQSHFVPIAKLVQKICTDEFQIHVKGDIEVLRNEMAIEENFPAFLEALDDINVIIKEITDSELNWLEFLFNGKEEIGKIRKENIRKFVLYSATAVYREIGIENPYGDVLENPLPYMNKWVVIDNNQASAQEETVGNYLLGAFVDDSRSISTDKYNLKF